MAQITYTKLGLKPELHTIKTIEVSPQVSIEVKQFLPLETKLDVLSNIINKSVDDRGFYNTARIEFNLKMELIYAYTNIKFTEKQLEDPMKLYDNFIASGLLTKIFEVIPTEDYAWFNKHANASIASIMAYRNSVYGILDALRTDYSDLDLNIESLRQKLAEDKNVGALKEIVDKMV